MDVRYRTQFHLTNEVADLEKAQDYLSEDDMTFYLKNSLTDECNYFELPMSHLKDKIVHIEWYLTSEDKGYIELITTEEIPQPELDQISRWISGQCSDGLGEGFEQQEFANYNYSKLQDTWGYYGGDDEEDWVMASFDWKTNDYTLAIQ